MFSFLHYSINNRIFYLGVDCPDQWKKLNDHCYYISEKSVNWLKARSKCKDRNADQVVPRSSENNQAINIAINEQNIGSVWIGLKRNMTFNNKFSAVGDHELLYENWSDKEPNNYDGNENCVEMLNGGKWNDLPCSQWRHYICQRF